ncbi:transcription intermediary factor 1-beta-like [Mytilus edulis]|uniref:transcription intermediary factor 1-beta-like n=1 Tax=Mytilus edulis TaxID=6550 RepID=UPI0039EE87C0
MAQAAASTCEICIGGPGEHYCLQCNQLFCESCKLSHSRANICKNHTFLSGPKKSDALFCPEHEERCLSYCHDCDTPVCIVCYNWKHRHHLMKELAESIQELKYKLFEKIETKVATANFNLDKIAKDTKAYREKVKAVIKTITREGKYWKQLIDKKVEALIKLVQDKEQRETQNMTAYSEVYKGVAENCQTWQSNTKKMKTTADILLLNKLKQLKYDFDQIVVKQIPNAPDVSYRNKKTSDAEIDNLFGELQFLNCKVVLRQTDKEKRAK